MTKQEVNSPKFRSVQQKTVSRDGFEFSPGSWRWRLSRAIKVNLSWSQRQLSRELSEAYKNLLRYYAETASAHHTVNLNESFKAFVRSTVDQNSCLTSITSTHLINYRSSLRPDKEYLLAVLRGLFTTWEEQGWYGIDADVVCLLKSWRLKGNQKGKAIQTLCPYDGALSDLEYEALEQALVTAFERNSVTLESFVLVMLFLTTGRRPAQIADLKISDLVEGRASDGTEQYVLRVPRRKQHGVGWREQFRDYALAPEIGASVKALIKNTKRAFRSDFDASSSPEQLSMFPFWSRVREHERDGANDWRAIVNGQWFHRSPASLRRKLQIVVKNLGVYSERTGQFLKVTPVRLRRTLGTRAAREGFGAITIAELLDHSDTQNAFVYTENVPEHLNQINRAVAEQLAPIAQAFAGVLVEQESDADRGDDLDSRIRSNESREGVGTCGHYGFCGAFAPIACYTCRHFQPWLDGPHEQVLDHLVAKRERIKAKTGDMEIAAVNDRTIFAVQQVVQLCEMRWREREEVADG